MDSANLRDMRIQSGLITISSIGPSSLGIHTRSTPGDSTWFQGSTAIFIPFRIAEPFVAINLWLFNGSVVNGNIDLGIYDVRAERIVSTGSTPQAGVSAIQAIAISALLLKPGVYYMALAIDNITARTQRTSTGNICDGRTQGLAQMAAAFPLPATVVLASLTTTNLPIMGLTLRSTV